MGFFGKLRVSPHLKAIRISYYEKLLPVIMRFLTRFLLPVHTDVIRAVENRIPFRLFHE